MLLDFPRNSPAWRGFRKNITFKSSFDFFFFFLSSIKSFSNRSYFSTHDKSVIADTWTKFTRRHPNCSARAFTPCGGWFAIKLFAFIITRALIEFRGYLKIPRAGERAWRGCIFSSGEKLIVNQTNFIAFSRKLNFVKNPRHFLLKRVFDWLFQKILLSNLTASFLKIFWGLVFNGYYELPVLLNLELLK